MKLTNLIIIISIFTLALIAMPLQAQDITNKLGGNTATETYDVTDSGDNLLFRVQGDKGALFMGTFGTGTIPATGAGTRIMWYPAKAAFRVGYVNGTQWDDTNIGDYSTAMGYGTTASGGASTAMGCFTIASGHYSTAMGLFTIASGGNSTAMGLSTIASGKSSTAMGWYTEASEESSTAMGYGTTASGGASTAIGYNTTASGYVSTAMGREIEASGNYTVAIALNDQNGTNVIQANTMAIMGGNVGIGTITPKAALDVNGAIYQRGSSLHADYVFEDDYELETITEHSDFMWKNKHLPAIPKATVDEYGNEIVEVGSHRKGMVEELEKAHIYITQLEERITKLEKLITE